MRDARRIVGAAGVVAWLALVPAVCWAQAGGIRVGASFGFGSYSIDDVNDFIDSKDRFMRDFEQSWDDPEYDYVDLSFSSEDLKGGAVFSGAVEFMVTNQIGVGVEFIPLSTSGDYSWRWEEWDPYYEEVAIVREKCDFDASANLVSLFGVYHLPLGGTGANVRLGGGAGYLFGGTLEMGYDGDVELEYYGRSPGRQENEWFGGVEATGSGVAFHALVGVEYPIMPQLLVIGDVAYRFAKIDELEVDDFSREDDGANIHPIAEDMEEGQPLTWIDYEGEFQDVEEWLPAMSTGRGDEVTLDFSGLYFSLGIAYVF